MVRINKNPSRIEGYCKIPGFTGEQQVMAVSKLRLASDDWHVASSMCLPSNIEAAKAVFECMSKVFEELAKERPNETD